MKHHLINFNSDSLLIFFTGWGCDEYEFEHLHSESDVLILYDYQDLKLDFDFSKYKNFNLMAFSAGVFAASVFKFDFKINKKLAISGNPFLFDEKLGLSENIQKILCNITEENADDFTRNYLVNTEEEYKSFHPSMRTIQSCHTEFRKLKEIYKENIQNIKDIYDYAIFGAYDKIFDAAAQKEFYKDRLRIIDNAKHNLFFRIKKFEDMFALIDNHV